jgi:ABC-type cobalamin transport system ATPase subunit
MRQGQLLASGAAAAVLTSEHLSATYQVPVQVYEVQGTPIIHVA